MDNILYTTPKQQIEKLKSQNLIIDNEAAAISALATYGYSNLIKSYREPYIVSSDTSTTYRSGTTFNQIFSLYMLDKNVRNAIIAAMLDLEEHIKEQASDVIADSFGTHQNDYLLYRNYRNKKKTKARFTLGGILNTMQKTLNTDKDPIHHYNKVHGIVPPWILFKSVYFSTIINFIDLFKISEQEKMVHRLYDISALGISENQGRKLMMDTLFLSLDYRNLAAHGGRIYNHSSNKTLRLNEIFSNSSQYTFTGFSLLLFALNSLNYKIPFNHVNTVMYKQVSRHCREYPKDVTYLGQILNVDIKPKHIVFITNKSDKYHSNPHCSGIKNAHKIDYNEAITKGYKPCKRCIKDK